jgi:hypothetical protein
MAFLSRHRSGSWRLRSSLAIAIMFATLSMALATAASAVTFAPQTTLTGTAQIGHSGLGSAVALSRDGNTALVGGANDNEGVGAVWVFVRRGATWTQQAKIVGKGEEGKGEFGRSVALSSDGKTALIGAPADNGGLGAAWVFTRSGSNWRQRGAKLTGKDAGGAQQEAHCDLIKKPEYNPGMELFCFVGHPARFGESVALSSDGDTALIGGPGDNEGDGAAWVFARSGSTWRQQGEKLTGGGEVNEATPGCCDGLPRHAGGRFGDSVALSFDGATALIGGPHDHTVYYEGGYDQNGGAAWVFTRSGSTWRQQGEKLTGGVGLGAAVALTGDGNGALIGDWNDEWNTPTAATFTRSGSTWNQDERNNDKQFIEPEEAQALPEDEFVNNKPRFSHLALSSDGNTALLGGSEGGIVATSEFDAPPGPPAAWVFTRADLSWMGPSRSVTCREQPCAVALSGDASTALVGTAVYVRSDGFPEVLSVTPNSAYERGGTSVTITGSGFTSATAVKFGSSSATGFTINSDNSITAISPPGTGTVDVTVTNAKGTSLTWRGDRFRYLPPSAPTVVTAPASAITQDSAVLHATVTSNGASVEACRFEYGTEAQRFFGEEFSVPCEVPGSGETPVEVSASVTGLSPVVRYVWKVVATNQGGTSSKEGPSFVTSF